MGTARNWFTTVQKKFIKSSHRKDVILHDQNLSQLPMIEEARDFPDISASSDHRLRQHIQPEKTLQQLKSSQSSGVILQDKNIEH
ncbi:hypothetical protein GQ457_02G013350 [Hibiscus cannabinus]